MTLSRFLQKLKLKDGNPRPASPNRASGPADPPQPAAVPAPSSSSLQEWLWNHAYDGLRADEPKIVEAYEKFLSTELKDDGGSSLAANDDGQHTERGRQLEQLIQIGLRRTEKVAAVKEKIAGGLQTVNIVKGLVSSAVQAAPSAAIAWVGVCFSLEILTNSSAEAQANRKGLAYVVSRMDWYWNLVGLLLDRDAHMEMHGLRGQLEEHILKLYGKLLLYQMKSVCLYHQNQGVVFLKDMVKLDDWRGQVDEIKEAEAAVQRDSQQYNSQRACMQLRDLVATADHQRKELLAIISVVQDQTSQQGKIYQDEKDMQCLHRLCITDPKTDKARIQSTKGGLLRDSYAWILGNPDFKQWQTHPDRGLLWIKGDPGKGKTMLLCGIIDELKQQSAGQPAYFFCQATDQNLNNATVVLRGLIFSLVCQQPQLISYVRKEYDAVGQRLFEGSNIWEAMSKILTAMLGDPALRGTIMVVDALDECGRDRSKLLKLIVDLSASHHVKWLVSSRNQPDIEEELGTAGQKVTLHLELNEAAISVAVKSYIQHKVHELARRKGYDETTRATVQKHFADKADNTFLWVALVYEELARENVRAWHALDILKSLPSGLNELYERMMGHIQTLRDAELCKQILAAASVVYRPLSMRELAAIVKLPAYFNDHPEALNILISSCGSFLTLRDDVVYFVHQSAKDFLLKKASGQILPRGITHQHRGIFLSSIKILSLTLRRNIYGLASPGSSIDNISPPDPDPLAHVRYSCQHWVDHLEAADPADKATLGHLENNSETYSFLQQTYLYWLEAMSLQCSISQAVLAMHKLQAMVAAVGSQRLAELVHDARRFVLSHKAAIEIAPLQLYASALVFSPTRSTVRNLFKRDEPGWVLFPPLIQPDWNSCAQTLECKDVASVALADDGTHFASGSWYGGVKIWDVVTGQCLKTLEIHGDGVGVLSVAFTPDSKWLAAGLLGRSLSGSNGIVQIWNIATGQCVQKLEGHGDGVHSVAFTADGKQLASGSEDKTVKIWDVTTEHMEGTGRCLKTLEGHSFPVTSVAFAANGMLASGSYDCTVRIWDVASGQCALTIDGPGRKDYPAAGIRSVAFTADGKQLALASDDHTIKIWDMARGKYVQMLVGHSSHVSSVAFMGDGVWLASGSYDKTIKIWDVDKGQCVQTLEGHSMCVNSVAFIANSTWLTSGLTWRLISGSSDTIKIWDVAVGHDVQKPDGHNGWVGPVTLMADGTRLASGSTRESTVKIWNTATGECVQTLDGHDRRGDSPAHVQSLAFTADGKRLASGSFNTTTIWDPATGECMQTLEDHDHHPGWVNCVCSLAFTADGKRLASGSTINIKIWDMAISACVQTLKGHDHIVNTLAFTADGTRLASGSHDYTVKIWDVDTCIHTLKGHIGPVYSVTFTADGTRVASGSDDGSIKIWDVATGACMETLSIGAPAYYLSFDPHTKATLLTEFGTLTLDPSSCHAQLQEASPTQPAYHGWGISPDGAWIVKDSQRLLWLPSEYRPWRTVVRGSCVALGCLSGRVIILKFSTEVLNL